MTEKTPDRVFIFDTTLRDGEQSPGFHLDANSKLRIARQLEKLGVDVIEAGFPISSPGDFEACRRIAREIRGATVTALARACLLYTSPSPRDRTRSRMPSSA